MTKSTKQQMKARAGKSNDEKSQKVGQTRTERAIVWTMSAGILLLIASGAWLLVAHWPNDSQELSPAELGDFIGGHVSAIGSATGTLLFFLALMMQRQELRDARTVFTQHKDISASELKLFQKQATTARQAVASEMLFTLSKMRHDLRLAMAQNVADNKLNPAWRAISSLLVDQYETTNTVVDKYLGMIGDSELRDTLKELNLHGVPIDASDA